MFNLSLSLEAHLKDTQPTVGFLKGNNQNADFSHQSKSSEGLFKVTFRGVLHFAASSKIPTQRNLHPVNLRY